MTDFEGKNLESELAALPQPLRSQVQAQWDEFRSRIASLPELVDDSACQNWLASLPRVWAASDFVARTCLAFPDVLTGLIQDGSLCRPRRTDEMAARVAIAVESVTDEVGIKKALRLLRRREMLRIAWRDLAGWADLTEVLTDLSAFAEACVDQSLMVLHGWAAARNGRPVTDNQQEASLIVLGMGKVGGEELNFSSDIDLIFAYTGEGETVGSRGLSNHEFFTRLARLLIDVLNDNTEDGFVFRVDMRLRPNGASGALVLSVDAMEQYYQAHGREWERYALIKARQIGGDRVAGTALLERIRPFVYRRYLDYGAIEAIRALKIMIERELLRKGIEDNIKLGPGGIREIEFIGQAFQLIRGGREPALRERRIRRVLELLSKRGDITPQAARELRDSYDFLRRTENRLQMAEDRQVHSLPQDDDARLRLALAMGYTQWSMFQAGLRRHMGKVHGYFEQVFVAPQQETLKDDRGLAAVWQETLDPQSAAQRLAQAGYQDADATIETLRALRHSRAYGELSAHGRERLDKLMPLLLAAAGLSTEPATTLNRLVTLIEAIARRSVYLALLIENPLALSQLVKLCAASAWIADWITQHPVLLDELIDPVSLYAPPPIDELRAELQMQLASLAADDLDRQMETLREFRHGHILRVAAADVGPGLSTEEASGHLADIADVVLEQVLALASSSLAARHGRPACRSGGEVSYPGFAVVAYGKLGSRELGYGSDLDLLFLHDACADQGMTDGASSISNEVFFARLGQRLIHVLTIRTPAGILYPVDMRLRPSGSSGLLVSTVDAFRDYQLTKAWTWEHQALVRARVVAGSAQIGRTFEAIRSELLCRGRDPEQLRQDIAQMRTRMRTAKAGASGKLFDLKQDPGGMIDIEFMVQYWILRHAREHPGLTGLRGNVRILEALADAGLLNATDARVLIEAYRRYLSLEHRLKLLERSALVAANELGRFPQEVTRIWRATIGTAAD